MRGHDGLPARAHPGSSAGIASLNDVNYRKHLDAFGLSAVRLQSVPLPNLMKPRPDLPLPGKWVMLSGGGPLAAVRFDCALIEYYILNEAGERPLYRWGQTDEFWQAGCEMPAKLRAIAESTVIHGEGDWFAACREMWAKRMFELAPGSSTQLLPAPGSSPPFVRDRLRQLLPPHGLRVLVERHPEVFFWVDKAKCEFRLKGANDGPPVLASSNAGGAMTGPVPDRPSSSCAESSIVVPRVSSGAAAAAAGPVAAVPGEAMAVALPGEAAPCEHSRTKSDGSAWPSMSHLPVSLWPHNAIHPGEVWSYVQRLDATLFCDDKRGWLLCQQRMLAWAYRFDWAAMNTHGGYRGFIVSCKVCKAMCCIQWDRNHSDGYAAVRSTWLTFWSSVEHAAIPPMV